VGSRVPLPEQLFLLFPEVPVGYIRFDCVKTCPDDNLPCRKGKTAAFVFLCEVLPTHGRWRTWNTSTSGKTASATPAQPTTASTHAARHEPPIHQAPSTRAVACAASSVFALVRLFGCRHTAGGLIEAGLVVFSDAAVDDLHRVLRRSAATELTQLQVRPSRIMDSQLSNN
jgi:hypothetical protein